MSQAPVSCIPAAGKMSKAKRVLDEARESQNPELDLADKAVASFEDLPGLRESPSGPVCRRRTFCSAARPVFQRRTKFGISTAAAGPARGRRRESRPCLL